MSDTEQGQDRHTGSVPHTYRTALVWRWAPAMPKGLPGSFLTVLHVLSSTADPHGRVRFRDGKPVRIQDLAAAARVDEKDCRRYLDAAITAGVVGIVGERKRGKATLYALIVNPAPDWTAAVSVLESTRRKPRNPPPWLPPDGEKNGGVAPELEGPKFGGHAPELPADPDNEVRGTRPRMSSGDTPPLSSGDTPPNNPWITHEVSHDGAEVVPQPQVDPGWDLQEPPEDDPDDEPCEPDGPPADTAPVDFRRCARCHLPMAPRPGRTTHAHCATTTAA